MVEKGVAVKTRGMEGEAWEGRREGDGSWEERTHFAFDPSCGSPLFSLIAFSSATGEVKDSIEKWYEERCERQKKIWEERGEKEREKSYNEKSKICI